MRRVSKLEAGPGGLASDDRRNEGGPGNGTSDEGCREGLPGASGARESNVPGLRTAARSEWFARLLNAVTEYGDACWHDGFHVGVGHELSTVISREDAYRRVLDLALEERR